MRMSLGPVQSIVSSVQVLLASSRSFPFPFRIPNETKRQRKKKAKKNFTKNFQFFQLVLIRPRFCPKQWYKSVKSVNQFFKKCQFISNPPPNAKSEYIFFVVKFELQDPPLTFDFEFMNPPLVFIFGVIFESNLTIQFWVVREIDDIRIMRL